MSVQARGTRNGCATLTIWFASLLYVQLSEDSREKVDKFEIGGEKLLAASAAEIELG